MGKILNTLLDDSVFEKIGNLVDKTINQIDKIEKLEKKLKDYGLRIFDCGTNRVVFRHKEYPKAVFKIALDEQGVKDNLNEYEKSDKSHRFPTSFDIDADGLILVQRRDKLIDQEDFDKEKVQKGIRKMLKELEEKFVLVDLGMDKRKNFGIDEDGEYTIIDFGYVTYIDLANFNCPTNHEKNNGKMKYCKGKLEYNKNYTMLKCPECENVFKVSVVLTGYGEHQYTATNVAKEYKPSDELYEFYQRFNDSRDEKLLKEYVKLNTKSNTLTMKGGNDKVSSFKDQFLRKVNGAAGPTAKVEEPKQQKPVVAEKKESYIQQQTERAVKYPSNTNKKPEPAQKPVMDDDGYSRAPNSMSSNDVKQMKVDIIKKALPPGSMGDDILFSVLFERFPELREKLEKAEVTDITSLPVIDILDYITVDTSDKKITNIYINLDAPKYSEDVNTPFVYFNHNGVTYALDIVNHLKALELTDMFATLKDSEMPNGVVSYMYVLPVDEFDGNYETQYFEPTDIEAEDDNEDGNEDDDNEEENVEGENDTSKLNYFSK